MFKDLPFGALVTDRFDRFIVDLSTKINISKRKKKTPRLDLPVLRVDVIVSSKKYEIILFFNLLMQQTYYKNLTSIRIFVFDDCLARQQICCQMSRNSMIADI